MPTEVTAIQSWHAHIYYDPAATRDVAAVLREQVAERFPSAILGRWHDRPVGPHPQAMYQIAFANADFPALAPFLALNRQGLAVLIHPESGRPKDDHLRHAMWLGQVLPLDASMLPEVETAHG